MNWGWGFGFCLALATQVTGYGFAGAFRRLLIKPASLIWPQTLVYSALLNTLHADEDFDFRGPYGGITRYRWFLWVFGGTLFAHETCMLLRCHKAPLFGIGSLVTSLLAYLTFLSFVGSRPVSHRIAFPLQTE